MVSWDSNFSDEAWAEVDRIIEHNRRVDRDNMQGGGTMSWDDITEEEAVERLRRRAMTAWDWAIIVFISIAIIVVLVLPKLGG